MLLVCVIVDLPLWEETDGTVEYLRKYLEDAELAPPGVDEDFEEQVEEEEEAPELVPVVVPAPAAASSSKKSNKDEAPKITPVQDLEEDDGFYYDKESIRDLHLMYQDMFMTGVEAIEDLLTGR